MTWNYRIVRMNVDMGDGAVEPMLGVHEAYYGEDGVVHSITEEPITIVGESVDVLQDVIDMIQAALDEEVLDYEDY